MRIEPVELPKVGLLEPQFFDSGELLCFACRVPFRNSEPELIVYPSGDDQSLSAVELQELSARYFRFLDTLDYAMGSFPNLLRAECARYQIAVDHLSDADLTHPLEWENIKLDPTGTVECYARNALVTTNFDLALGFRADGELDSVHFDG